MTDRNTRLQEIRETVHSVSGESLNAASEKLIYQDIPWLLDEIERLEAENSRQKTSISQIIKGRPPGPPSPPNPKRPREYA